MLGCIFSDKNSFRWRSSIGDARTPFAAPSSSHSSASPSGPLDTNSQKMSKEMIETAAHSLSRAATSIRKSQRKHEANALRETMTILYDTMKTMTETFANLNAVFAARLDTLLRAEGGDSFLSRSWQILESPWKRTNRFPIVIDFNVNNMLYFVSKSQQSVSATSEMISSRCHEARWNAFTSET
jgi:hypothetical protein